MAKKTKKKETNNKKEKTNKSKLPYIIFVIIYVLILVFAFTNAGIVGIFTNNALTFSLGRLYLIPALTILFFVIRATLLSNKNIKLGFKFYVGLILFNIFVFLIDAIFEYASETTFVFNDVAKPIFGELVNIAKPNCSFRSGICGTALYAIFIRLFSKVGTYIVVAIILLASIALLVPLKKLKEKGEQISNELFVETKEEKKNKKKLRKEIKVEIADSKEEVEVTSEGFDNKNFITSDELEKRKEEVKPTQEAHFEQITIDDNKEIRTLKRVSNFKGYKIPTSKDIILLSPENSNSNKNKNDAEARGRKLIQVLRTFGVNAKLEQIHIGPSVTKFEIKPESSVNLSKISSLSDNLKMELAAKSIRIEAPIPGRSAVGIEVPNTETVAVRMSELVTKIPVKFKSNKLLFALGKDLLGSPVFCQLNKMPHLLIAGATGSGKSVCINTIITSFLLRTRPDEVKLVLVDPKKVEFTPYHDIPHLMWPVITDAKEANLMLQKIVLIMQDRFDAFSKLAVRDITSFNEKVVEHNNNLKEGEEKMSQLPYIVVIIDELADLMQVANKEVEASIQRITQLARASGIHLIVATQRPSTDVITGLIKSNIPSRISFAVASSIDSRTILDSTGAEKLLGNGDMLYSPQGESAPIRLQGCYVTDAEIESITNYVKKQAKPEYDDTCFAVSENGSAVGQGSCGDQDPLYEEVVEFVRTRQAASVSLLQRRFGIGYNRSARIIDTLEENGLIGPQNGSKPREVFLKKEDKK